MFSGVVFRSSAVGSLVAGVILSHPSFPTLSPSAPLCNANLDGYAGACPQNPPCLPRSHHPPDIHNQLNIKADFSLGLDITTIIHIIMLLLCARYYCTPRCNATLVGWRMYMHVV